MVNKRLKKENLLNTLTDYFKKREDVIMAFLFGSTTKNRNGPESDVDIAVFLQEEKRDKERTIELEIEKLLKKEVDMVYLNRAPSIISWQAIRKGVPLTIKDRGLFIDFMLKVSREAEDFVDFNLDALRRRNEIRKVRSRAAAKDS